MEVNRLDEDALVMFDACAIDTLRYEKNLKSLPVKDARDVRTVAHIDRWIEEYV